MSKYVLFTNKSRETLIYYACPKNANSSAKLFFAKHTNNENNFKFLSDIKPKYMQKKSDFLGVGNLENFLPNYQPFDKAESNYKCCIVRNPLKRFISTYKNRILFHRDKNFRLFSIDMILDKLESNSFDNRHFLPQAYFLGNDLKYYSFYSSFENINFFKDGVNSFFGKDIKFPKIQVGGNQIRINISAIQVKRVKKIYEVDYDLLSNHF